MEMIRKLFHRLEKRFRRMLEEEIESMDRFYEQYA